MLRGVSGWVAAACVFLLSACSWIAPTPELDAAARITFQRFQSGDTDAILREGSPILVETDAASTIQQIRSLLPHAPPTETQLVGYSWSQNSSEPSSQHRLTYEFRWPDEVALMNFSFERFGEMVYQLNGFTVRVASRAELAANDFTLLGKPLGHYLMLAAVFVSPLLMIIAIVMTLRTPGLERRWLFCFLSIVTVCMYRLDWANGASQFVLIQAGLITVGMTRSASLFSSWVLATGIPVGAIYVLVRVWLHRRNLKEDAGAATPAA
jgi:hypothetical protein